MKNHCKRAHATHVNISCIVYANQQTLSIDDVDFDDDVSYSNDVENMIDVDKGHDVKRSIKFHYREF